MAALANMSSKFVNLHPYVCQRFNSLFNLLSKKRIKLIKKVDADNSSIEEYEHKTFPEKNLIQDLAIIEELMRMVLEIINSCIINSIHHNTNLIYSILYHKNLYVQFYSHPNFQDVIANIEFVCSISLKNLKFDNYH